MSEPPSKKLKSASALTENADQVSTMTEEQKTVLMEMDAIQSEIDKHTENASEEIVAIEKKYYDLRQPFVKARSEKIKKLPGFWAVAILNHSQLSAIVSEDEEKLLSEITDIEIIEEEDVRNGFTLKIFFNKNSWFDNEVVTKVCALGDEPHTETSEIKWKEGKKPSQIDVHDGEALTFTQWLASNIPPDVDEIAEVLKDDLYCNPLQYYLMPDAGESHDEDVLEEDDDDEVQVVESDADGH